VTTLLKYYDEKNDELLTIMCVDESSCSWRRLYCELVYSPILGAPVATIVVRSRLDASFSSFTD